MKELLGARAPAGEHPAADSRISFIIPAYNEEKFLAATLRSIHAAAAGLAYDITVVDNGSTDRTPVIAAENGAHVLCQQGGTIGALRNAGARSASGDVLVFIDADVTLTSLWRDVFAPIVALLDAEPVLLAGSSCSIPSGASWIEKVWFAARAEVSLSHLGSAHLIASRSRFLGAGGFDESLETGEDYELSQRVREMGGRLYRLPRAVVEHHGYPRTLSQFFRREVWHGTSDCTSVLAIAKSRVASLSVVLVAFQLVALGALLAGTWMVAAVALMFVVLICTAASVRLFRAAGIRVVLSGSFLHYVYFTARACSIARVLTRRSHKPRSREVSVMQTGA